MNIHEVDQDGYRWIMARDGGIMMYHGDSTYPNGHGQRLEIIDEPLAA